MEKKIVMRFGIGVRYANLTEPAQTLYLNQLVKGLTSSELNSRDDTFYLYGNHHTQLPFDSLIKDSQSQVEPYFSTLPIHRMSVGVAWEQAVLPFLIHKHRLDLYHGPFFYLPLIKGRSHLKTVVTFDDLSFEHNPEYFTKRTLAYFRTIGRASAKHADAIITISQTTKNDLVNTYQIAPEKIHPILFAPNPEFINTFELNTHEFSKLSTLGIHDPYILVVGVIHPRKNLNRIVDAFAKIHKDFPRYKLVFVGRKALRAHEVENQITALHLQDKVQFISGVPQKLMPTIYKNATCLVMCSSSEGFGFPALEAMITNTPVVATNEGSLPEVLGKCGRYFNPHQKDDLADQLSDVLKNPPNSQDLLEKYRTQLSLFSWEKNCRETLQLYWSVLKNQLP